MHFAKKVFLFLALCAVGISAMAQEKITVTGHVTDAQTGEPLIAVGVVVKGTTNGVITALDGDYSIVVPKGTTLLFSMIGYEDVEMVAELTVIDVVMKEDSKMLDEVVVVGYGVQKKSSLTGSVSSVKAQDIQARGVTNLTEAISGKTSGVQSYSTSASPGSAPSLQVRGIGSNGASAPLYVIDGRIGAPGNINPNDIESVEVLKDGSSAAIYGASAGNGVILITTKKGKGNGTISYDMQLASQSLARVPHLMNSEQFIDYWVDAGTLTLETVLNNWDGQTNTDWLNTVFGHSMLQKHSVTFQGGSDRGQFYLSGSYLDNDGMVVGKGDTYQALTAMVNASYKVKSWLEVGTNNVVEYSRRISLPEGGTSSNVFQSIMGITPLVAPYYTLESLPDGMREYYNNQATLGTLLSDGNGNYYGVPTFITTNRTNPLILRDKGTSESRGFSLSGTTYANINPMPWLNFTSRIAYSYTGAESYSNTRKYISNVPSGDYRTFMSVSAGSSDAIYWQWENFANLTKAFGSHFFTAMLGSSVSESRSFGVSGGKSGDYSDEGFPYDDPAFLYMAYANDTAIKSVSGGEPFYGRKMAFFGRANYSYKDKYLAQVSLRADAADSSVLPYSDRWGFFPAASLGWVVSKEDFMQGTKGWLDQFKLRASWGRNGSLASLGNWMYSRTISRVGRYPFSDSLDYTYAYAPTVDGNDHLKWETSEQLDLGADLALLGNRFTASFDWYEKNTRDLIVTGVRESYATGFAPSPINAGNIRNRGIELELGWQDHIGDFNYGIRGNLTTLKNEVTAIHEKVERIQGSALVTGPLTMFEKGYPAWYFYGYEYKGVDKATGDPIFSDAKTYIGKGIPDLTYGITITAGWKGLDLVVFGSGVQGVDIYNLYDPSSEYVVNRLSYFNEDRWTAANPSGTKPRVGVHQSDLLHSSFNVFDGSFFKIKQIQLGYSFPKSILDKAGFSNLRIYGSLEDFFTFSDYIGYDPEINAVGLDFGSYPSAKKVLLGLSITF